MINCNEAELVSRFKKGDQEAFGDLFKLHAPRLGNYLVSLVCTSIAEDVVQDTFVRVWENRAKIDSLKSFTPYITSIAKNIIYDRFRHQIVEQQYAENLRPLLVKYSSTEIDFDLQGISEAINAGIDTLTTQQQQVMRLKITGFSNDEIAQLLSISKRTVEVHLNKAYKKMRVKLHDVEYLFLLFCSAIN